jgi:hypothetical protein
MVTRRGFLWLCGASGAGIYLAKAGLIELPKRMVLQMAGTCSFCGKDRREVFAIAGVVGSETRICDECVGLCFDILGEESEALERLTEGTRQALVAMTDREMQARVAVASDELERLLRAANAAGDADQRSWIEAIQARLKTPSQRPRAVQRDFHCSFCGRARQDVRKLISGPRVFICDACAGDAAGLLAASGWRFRASV